ncbi:MAG: extracellular solute-binding protein [Spirochaetales bacterium]|nr:extracellular solute-binding protein [Spirochaetales bacterium]
MKRMLKKLTIIALICIFTAGFAFARGDSEGTKKGLKEMSIFLAYPKEDYPVDGTILGDWTEKQTGVRLKWEFIVGDLKQKLGLMIAGGNYPDFINARNEMRRMYDSGALIPLDDLIEQYGTNAKKFYGKRLSMLEQEDGKIYWFPQLFPYTDRVQRTGEAHGLYIQKAVLKENGWPIPESVEAAMDMLIKYAKKYPEINGHKTYAFTALTYDWRRFPLYNAPSIMTGHPNDGEANVDWVDGKWVATQFFDTPGAYKIYKIYNEVYREGLYDPESFVMDYDQYLAKLSTGSILAFYDQAWQFEKVQKLLKKQGQDRWWVPLPIVMEGYKEEYEGPLQPQTSEGVGISVDCKDPVAAFKYLDFLCSEDAQIKRQWGFEGKDYLIDENGYFYRTQEMLDQWDDSKWLNNVFGQTYWINLCGFDHASVFSDGKNAVSSVNQPSIFYNKLLDTEKEVLTAYGKKTWYDFFRGPDMRRAVYFPVWTIKIPTGSDIDIFHEKRLEVWKKYVPLLIMAKNDEEYDKLWKEYTNTLSKLPNKKEHAQFYQDQIDERIKKAGGYQTIQ